MDRVDLPILRLTRQQRFIAFSLTRTMDQVNMALCYSNWAPYTYLTMDWTQKVDFLSKFFLTLYKISSHSSRCVSSSQTS